MATLGCLTCGVPLKSKRIWAGGKFCSNLCHKASMRKIRLDLIKKTGIVDFDPGAMRRYLIEIDGHICQICKLTKWNDEPIPLVCDHIDGNSTNRRRSNLRMICPNCDAQTPTYKARNRGNGRHYRRTRYAEGKSY